MTGVIQLRSNESLSRYPAAARRAATPMPRKTRCPIHCSEVSGEMPRTVPGAGAGRGGEEEAAIERAKGVYAERPARRRRERERACASSSTGADPTGIPRGAASCRTSVSSTARRLSSRSIRSSRLIRRALLPPLENRRESCAPSACGTP